MNNNYNKRKSYSRFLSEFWIICTMVGLGFVYSLQIGFYEFRLVDLIFIFSVLYFFSLLVKKRIEKKAKLVIFFSIVFILIRVWYDFNFVSNIVSLRTLFGISVTFLTPLIYFVVRESYFDKKKAKVLLIIACIISLLSQLNLLNSGESEVSGAVDLGSFLGIKKSYLLIEFQERTITVWRALSIGITFSVIFVKTKSWIKLVGILGLFLQTAGGGGGRGGLLFVVLTPIIIFFVYKNYQDSLFLKRIILGGVLGIFFASVYLWAPFGDKLLAKSSFRQTHYERATEITTLFTGGWTEVTRIGGFNARTIGYEEYFERIFSDQNIFLWGAGFYKGAAFEYVVNGQAHNMFLDIWGRSGIIGILLFTTVIIFIISDLKKLLQTTPQNTEDKIIVLSISIAVLYFLQPLMFQAVTSDRSFMIVFFLTAGLLKPLRRWVNGEFQQ